MDNGFGQSIGNHQQPVFDGGISDQRESTMGGFTDQNEVEIGCHRSLDIGNSSPAGVSDCGVIGITAPENGVM